MHQEMDYAPGEAAPRASGRKDRHDGFTAERRRTFIEALKKGCVLDACRAAGISNRTAYNWYHADCDFARQWDAALCLAAEQLELTAVQRGIVGVEEPVWAYGKVVGTRIRRSDAIFRLLFAAASRRKETKRIGKEARARLAAERLDAGQAYVAVLGEIDAIEHRLHGESGNFPVPDESRELHGGSDGGGAA